MRKSKKKTTKKKSSDLLIQPLITLMSIQIACFAIGAGMLSFSGGLWVVFAGPFLITFVVLSVCCFVLLLVQKELMAQQTIQALVIISVLIWICAIAYAAQSSYHEHKVNSQPWEPWGQNAVYYKPGKENFPVYDVSKIPDGYVDAPLTIPGTHYIEVDGLLYPKDRQSNSPFIWLYEYPLASQSSMNRCSDKGTKCTTIGTGLDGLPVYKLTNAEGGVMYGIDLPETLIQVNNTSDQQAVELLKSLVPAR